jgi:hypothetical protein
VFGVSLPLVSSILEILLLKTCETPASGAVEWIDMAFTAALFNKTEYMGFPDDEID